MKNIIVGTAGHIDHGKTSLIQALTGISTDRLAEEKRRGISIDLGFAHLQLTDDIRLGFVDVPGHERFIKNMLAGAAGIDLVLFVVAADESVKPQTREHFDICRLLGVRAGVIAITKSDAADPEILELTQLEVEELIAGSFLEGAPIVPVSAKTGKGLDDLRAALALAADRVPPKNTAGPARLPIDRAFTMRGFGTVVTGTLVSGVISRDQELQLLPGSRSIRVRAVQVYGEPAECAVAGMRTALNVPNLDINSVRRGMALVERDHFISTSLIDCLVKWLPNAPPAKSRMPVHFHVGTSNTIGQLRILGEDLSGPNTFLIRILLKEPVVAAFGDRFIIRRFSPVVTVGGGVILDTRPARRINRSRLQTLAGNDTPAMVALLIGEAEWGIDERDVAIRLSMPARDAVRFGCQSGALFLDQHRWLIDRLRFQQTSQQLVQTVTEYHRSTLTGPEMARQELRNMFRSAPAFVFDSILSSTSELLAQADTVRLRSFTPTVQADEEAARQKLVDIFETAGFTVPGIAECLASTGLDLKRAKAILQNLLRSGVLLRLTDDLLLHSSMLARLREILAARSGQAFTVSEFKEWTGVSRKYAVPLLELADRQKLTRRIGEVRTIVIPKRPN